MVDDKKRGLTARVVRKGEVDETALKTLLGNYTNPWEWAEDVSEPA